MKNINVIEFSNICVASLEVFLPQSIEKINEAITKIIGDVPSTKPYDDAPRTGFCVYEWNNFSIIHITNHIRESFTEVDDKSLALMETYFETMTIKGIDYSDLPFYYVYIFLTFKRDIQQIDDFDFKLVKVREILQKFIGTLPDSASPYRRHGSGSPSIILLDAKVEQDHLDKMNTLLSYLQDETITDDHAAQIGFEINKNQIALSGDIYTGHAKSYFRINENLHAIIGSINGMLPYDPTCPYLLITTNSDKINSHPGFNDIIIIWDLYLIRNPWEWSNPLLFLMLVESWTFLAWYSIRNYRQKLSRLSEKLLSNASYEMTLSDLNELTELGLDVSALKISLGRITSRTDLCLDKWCKSWFGSLLKEISIPFVNTFEDCGYTGKEGYLPLVARSIKNNIEELGTLIIELENQIKTLSTYGNQITVRKSTIASERSSSIIEILTWLLFALTFIMIILQIGNSFSLEIQRLIQVISLLGILMIIGFVFYKRKIKQ